MVFILKDEKSSELAESVSNILREASNFYEGVSGKRISTPKVEIFLEPSILFMSKLQIKDVFGTKHKFGFFTFDYPDNIFINIETFYYNNIKRDLHLLELVTSHELYHKAHYDKLRNKGADKVTSRSFEEQKADFFATSFITRGLEKNDRTSALLSPLFGRGFDELAMSRFLHRLIKKSSENEAEFTTSGRLRSRAFIAALFAKNDFNPEKTLTDLIRSEEGEKLLLPTGGAEAEQLIKELGIGNTKAVLGSAAFGALLGGVFYSAISESLIMHPSYSVSIAAVEISAMLSAISAYAVLNNYTPTINYGRK